MKKEQRHGILRRVQATALSVVMALALVPAPALAEAVDEATQPQPEATQVVTAEQDDSSSTGVTSADTAATADSTEELTETTDDEQATSEQPEAVAGTLAAAADDTDTSDDATTTLAAGTYTVTANLSMPGQYNPVLTGVTVYPTTQNNPFGPTIDENTSLEVANSIPLSTVSQNATLYVATDGSATLYLPIPNPIFTTQDLGTSTSSDVTSIAVEKVAPTNWNGGGNYEGNYNNRTSRIHRAEIGLKAAPSTGTGSYIFKGSKLYAVPLDRELAPDGDVALQLDVDFSSATKTSDDTTAPALVTDKIVVNTPILGSDGKVLVGSGTQGFTVDNDTNTVTLKDGYVWADGTTDPKVIKSALDNAKDALQSAIDDAQAQLDGVTVSTDGSDVATDAKWVTEDVAQTLKDAIATATTAKDAEDATADSVNDATTTLNAAVAIFTAAQQAGTKSTEPTTGLEPGTYTISANLGMGGEDNPVLVGTTVYANTPVNPFSVIDENEDIFSVDQINFPTERLSDNATLVVTENGTRYLYLPVSNPVFTTQEIGTCDALANVWTERVTATNTYGIDDGDGGERHYITMDPTTYQYTESYGGKPNRIHKLLVQMKSDDDQTTGEITYSFSGSKMWATPLMTEVPTSLKLVIDYSTAKKNSTSTEVPALVTDKVVVNKPDLSTTELTYNGKTQTMVYKNTGYDIDGTEQAMDPGSYTFTLKLKDGYVWNDGTSDDVVCDWTITGPEVPENKDSIKIPTGTNLVFDGKSHTGIGDDGDATMGEGYLVVHPNAINAGDYTTTVKLLDGCTWEDGTTEDKQVSFTISPRKSKLTRAEVVAKVEANPIKFDYKGESINWGDYIDITPGGLYDGCVYYSQTTSYGGSTTFRLSAFDSSCYPNERITNISASKSNKYWKNFEWADGGNEPVEGTIDVTPATLTTSIKDQEMTYGDTSFSFSEPEVTGFVSDRDVDWAKTYHSSLNLPSTIVVDHEGEELSTLAVGKYDLRNKLSSSFGGKTSMVFYGAYVYDISNAKATLTVNPATLNVSLSDAEMYTGDAPDFSATVTGFVNDETANTAADYVAPTVTVLDADGNPVTDVSKLKAGTYTMEATGGSAKNYTFNYGETGKVTATLTVKQGSVTVYRLYNQWSGEHLFTTDKAEYDGLVELGWNGEEIGWYAPNTSDTPVYRLYNPYSGDHLYTSDEAEYASLHELGWNQEGIAFYSMDADDPTAQPIYRLYNKWLTAGTHLYTTDKAEYDGLVELGWSGENIAFYGVTVPTQE